MAVLRITANRKTDDPTALADFYGSVFGLDVAMDMGFVVTLQGGQSAPVQLQFATEGGSGTEVPDLSIEVDDLDAVLEAALNAHAEIPYGPVDEPWGVRRFYLRDPAGTLVNVLTHVTKTDS